MRSRLPVVVAVLSVLSSLTPSDAGAQAASEAIRERVEGARAAAGADHTPTFARLCEIPVRAIGAAPAIDDVPPALPSLDPDRPWYTPPVRVFDNLYFLGQTVFSVWAVRTSEGIILVDAIFDYSVEAEVIEGLRALSIDPAEIRYVIISHAHADHSGGAGILQQRYGARVIMSAADWDLYERGSDAVKATRDIVATDGMEVRLGDTTLSVHLTPGHTLGTMSTIIPVRDNGQAHVAALWGGTLFNFRGAPGDPRDARLEAYSASAGRFREIARAAGADIILSNHTAYDGSTVKLPTLAQRRPGTPHPYVIGADAVSRFFTVAEQCSIATRLAERGAGG
jgi:metallo-beta-lactamase class B